MTEKVYSEGICGDGAAILKHGVMINITETVALLNEYQEMIEGNKKERAKQIRFAMLDDPYSIENNKPVKGY